MSADAPISSKWHKLHGSEELENVLAASPAVTFAETCDQLVNLACGGADSSSFSVEYHVPGRGPILEAMVARVRNGIGVNFPEPYMRRRDPDCMVVADTRPTDKPTYLQRFGQDFQQMRESTFAWLRSQELLVLAFISGHEGMGVESIAVMPVNAAFFGLALAMMQGILPVSELGDEFKPGAVFYVAPPFRHTHFDGKQVVVHNRLPGSHEMFAYNLYPGPSAKKGVFGVLIGLGEKEGWITAHCSTVRIVTPYDNVLTIMHEGASGGGKSEMLEQPHRQPDGRLLLGRNTKTGERRYLQIPRTCDLYPVTDDMALCHTSLQGNDGHLRLTDAEDAWFVRVDHITEYGTDPGLEKLTAQAPSPFLFLNIDAVPRSRALIWEHIEDEPGHRCPNPRVIIPRSAVPGIVNEPVAVDIRSMGIRMPPCTREKPTYGIAGMFHILPPALAWLWRLVAPRGHDNPSIISGGALASEGVGSYWPFATGRRVDQANLLLQQFRATSAMRYVLIPNQYVGAWHMGFMPEWIAREYLARRGIAPFRSDQIVPSRCPLLGYSIFSMHVEGTTIPHWLLEVETQPEVGEEGFDAGARILRDFFHEQLRLFLVDDLDPQGREIIERCLADATVRDYEQILGAAI